MTPTLTPTEKARHIRETAWIAVIVIGALTGAFFLAMFGVR